MPAAAIHHKDLCQITVSLFCLKFAGFKLSVVGGYLGGPQFTRLRTPAGCMWAQELPGCAGQAGKHALQGCSPHSQRVVGCQSLGEAPSWQARSVALMAAFETLLIVVADWWLSMIGKEHNSNHALGQVCAMWPSGPCSCTLRQPAAMP